MEVKKVCVIEHGNKENIPPFSTTNKPGLDAQKGKCKVVKSNEGRRPLRDITNLYRAAEKCGQAEFRDVKLPSSALFSSNRKRKLVDDDSSEHRSRSKTLRIDFR